MLTIPRRPSGLARVLATTMAALFLLCAVTGQAVASPGCKALTGRSSSGWVAPRSQQWGPYAYNQGDTITLGAMNVSAPAGETPHLALEESGLLLVELTSAGFVSYTSPSGSFLYSVHLTNGSVNQWGLTCYSVPPTLTGVSPNPEVPGSGVTLTGTGFYGTSAVTFGGMAATFFSVVSDTQINAGVPLGVGTVSLNVTTDAGAANIPFTFVPAVDLAVTHTVSNPTPDIGENVTFTVKVTNNGPADATNVDVTYVPVAGLTLVSGTPSQGTYLLPAGPWDVGTVSAGASATLTLTATVTALGTMTTTATGAANEFDLETSNNSANATVTVSAPIAGNTSVVVPYGSSGAALDLSSLITGGTHTSIAIATAPAHGTASVSGDVVTYAPTAGYAGPDSFTYTATGPSGTSAPGTVAITVSAPTIAISPATLPGATGSTPYSQTITASGGTGPYAYTLTAGALPAGMTLSSAGALSGTPTATGTYDFTVRATDSSTGGGPFSSDRAYSLVVGAPTITLSPATFAPGVVGVLYSQTITASGGDGSYTYALLSGALPTGLALSGAGVLSGTPTAAGTYGFTFTATDGNGFSGSQAYSVVVGQAAQAITNFAANPSAPAYAPNGTFTLGATPGASNSPVVYASTTPAICTVSGSTVTMLGAGTCSLTANQAGDANYAAAPQVVLNVAIAAAVPVIGWIGPLSRTVGSAAFDLPAPTSTSPGAFTYGSSNTGVATVSGDTVTIVGVGTATLTATQAATANYTAGSVSVTLTVDARPDPTRDPSVVDGLQAQVDAGVRFAATQQQNVFGRLRQLRNARGTPSQYGMALSMVGLHGGGLSLPLAANDARGNGRSRDFGLWTAGSIVLGEREANGVGNGFDLRSDGITLGADRAFGDFVFGAAAGAGWGSTDFAGDRSTQDASQRSLMVYGLWRGNGHWYADGMLGWGRLDFDLARWSATANALATAKREGDQQFGELSVGYIRRGKAVDITGYGRLEASRTTLDAYSEQGLGLYDLAYRDQRIDNSAIAVGVEGRHSMQLGEHAVRPFWSLEYRNALRNDGDAAMNYVVMPVASDYALRLRSYADNLWSLGVGLDAALGPDWQLSIAFRREQANGFSSNGLQLRVSFGGLAPQAPATAAQAIDPGP